MPKQSQTRTSFWEDMPTLEDIEAAAQRQTASTPSPQSGWGSGSNFSSFGQAWIESLNAGGAEQGSAGTHPNGEKTNAPGTAPAPGVGLSNLVLLNGIAARQVFEKTGPKRERSRRWEREHRSEVLQFSGIPETLHEKVLGLAEEMETTVGSIARSLLEYSLFWVDHGQIEVSPQLNNGKWSLFHKGAARLAWSTRGYGKGPPKTIKSKKRGKGGKAKKGGMLIVSYRGIPVEVQEKIKSIATSKDVPMSEVGRYLIEQAVSAYENGVLELRRG